MTKKRTSKFLTIKWSKYVDKFLSYEGRGFLGGSMVNNLFAIAGDVGLISGSGEGNGTPLQYSCLGDPLDREVRWAIVPEIAEESDMT